MNIFEIFNRFNTQKKCYDYLVKKRWNGVPTCPYCNCQKTHKHRKGYQCNSCHKDFTPTVGTIFHNSHIELNKWFIVISMMLNAKKGISDKLIVKLENMSLEDNTQATYSENDKNIIEKGDTGQGNRLTKEKKKNKNKK